MEAERGWRDRTHRMWGTTTIRSSTLSTSQKWFHRARQLYDLIPARLLPSQAVVEWDVYERFLRDRLDAPENHSVHAVVGATMVIRPRPDDDEGSWTFSVEAWKLFKKNWEHAAGDSTIFPYLRAHTTLFQILVYARRLSDM